MNLRLLILQGLLLLCFSIPSFAQDSDGDGIADSIDVDDDNDGILDVIECTDLGKDYLLNADFEDINIVTSGLDGGGTDVVGTTGIWKGDASNIPSWQSADAVNNHLEVWHNSQGAGSDAGGVAYSGIQWAEINATTNDGLYQDITTTPGDVLQWSFAHRKRTSYAGSSSEDVARLLIGDPGGTLTSQGDFTSAGDASWTNHSGTYTVPAGQTTTRLTFRAISVVSGSTSTGNFVDNVQLYVLPVCENSDGDSNPDYLDIDSDNDGIPDNIEGQPTTSYILPSGTVNATGTYSGLWNNYSTGVTPENTDGLDLPDYRDTDSDNDGVPDIQENGMANTHTPADSDSDGLLNTFETTTVNDATWDVNEDIHDPTDLSILPDTDGDLPLGGDLDYRDVMDVYIPSATIDFDGTNDYISTPSFMGGWQDATIMAWIKLDPTFASTGEIAGQDMFRMYVDGSSNLLRSYYITSASGSAYGTGSLTVLNTNQWYHVAISYEGTTGTTKMYVNGNLEKSNTIPSGTLTTNPAFTSNDLNIGRHSRTSSNYFKGAIDEVRVFQKALTEEQVQRMVYQEITQNGTSIEGTVTPGKIDKGLGDTLLWSDLEAYYPMSDILTSKTSDMSASGRTATLHNITTVQDQTAPMPYETVSDGLWTTESTWLHGDVWDIEDAVNNKDWAIVKIHNNVTTTADHTHMGLFVDAGNTLSLTGNNKLDNSFYLELNGTIDLANDSQLIQGVNSDLVTSASGKILRRQEGHTNIFRYNYWGSPVGNLGASALIDNNTSGNNTNNTDYEFSLLKDASGNIQFTNAFDPPLTSPATISTRWLYTFQNGVTYWDWNSLNSSSSISPGVGYIHKGPGTAGTDHQYTFEGKPNNGTILIGTTDTGGPGSVENISKTQFLLGNPYPSAIDAHKFIDDNVGVSSGTIYLWEQWAGNSHYLDEYEGGYATLNKMAKVRAYQFVGIDGTPSGPQNGTKTPTQFLPVAQGFLTEIIADGNIEFNNSQRIFKEEALGESVFFRGNPPPRGSDEIIETEEDNDSEFQTVRLEFKTSNDLSRELVIGFSETTSDAFDYGYDSTPNKFRDNDLATTLDGKKMVIQAFAPITTDDKIIDLVLNSDSNYNYSIRLIDIDNFDPSQEIYLRDYQENILFDIRNGDYEFTAHAGEDTDRFKLVFKGIQALEEDQELEEIEQGESEIEDLILFVNNLENKLYIKRLQEDLKFMSFTNTLGQTVKIYKDLDKYDLINGLPLSDLSTGIYFVNLTTANNFNLTKKIVID